MCWSLAGRSRFRRRWVGGEAQPRRHAAVCRRARGCSVSAASSTSVQFDPRGRSLDRYVPDHTDGARDSTTFEPRIAAPRQAVVTVDHLPSAAVPPTIPGPSLRNGSDAHGLPVGVSRSVLEPRAAPAKNVTIPRASRGHSPMLAKHHAVSRPVSAQCPKIPDCWDRYVPDEAGRAPDSTMCKDVAAASRASDWFGGALHAFLPPLPGLPSICS